MKPSWSRKGLEEADRVEKQIGEGACPPTPGRRGAGQVSRAGPHATRLNIEKAQVEQTTMSVRPLDQRFHHNDKTETVGKAMVPDGKPPEYRWPLNLIIIANTWVCQHRASDA